MTAAGSNQPILLVEDSPEDCERTRRALYKAGGHNPFFHCGDGNEALDFLFQRGAYQEPSMAPRPGIILLDLDLPGVSGHEILVALKQNAQLGSIPVIMLTASIDEQDIEACYAAGASGYIVKSAAADDFFVAIQRLWHYWFESVVLPKGEVAQ